MRGKKRMETEKEKMEESNDKDNKWEKKESSGKEKIEKIR